MANEGVSLPGGYGGLMRYNEEYASKINLKPVYVVVFIILIVLLRIFLPILIPIK